jgi:ankyrin repeat protein
MTPPLTRRAWLISSAVAPALFAEDADIFQAASAGDARRVSALLDQNRDLVNAPDPNGLRPLNHAARAGRAEVVMLLSSRGADLNVAAALLDAVDYPDSVIARDMVMTLAGNNARVDVNRDDGMTALHLAAARGHGDVCWMLIHRGAKPDVRARDGRTPADVAQGESVSILRNPDHIERVYFGSRFQKDRAGSALQTGKPEGTPRQAVNDFVTLSHGNAAEAKRILTQYPGVLLAPATFDELGVEAAAHLGYLDWCAELVDRGSPFSTCTAVVLGEQELVKQAIQEDRNRLRERGPHDQTLLAYTAFGKPQVETAEFLLAQGLDIESRALGQTTLHFAARRGHIDLADLLIDKGASINSPSHSRVFPGTPLGLALRSKQEKMAQHLRSRGAVE